MPEGTLVRLSPRRGKGPGVIVVQDKDSTVELTTFDSEILRMAAGAIGKTVSYQVEERSGKRDPSKTYKNVVQLAVLNGGGEAVEEQIADSASGSSDQRPKSAEVRALTPIGSNQMTHQTTLAQVEQGFDLAVRRYELLQSFIRRHFSEGTHYVNGEMFGASKPVLLQPGAYLIAHAYGLSLIPEIVDGPTQAPKDLDAHYTIVVKTTVYDRAGNMVGAAFGSATSTIWSGRQGRFVSRAVDPDKTHNACLKMAIKRSTVAAVRQSTDAASLFSEDLEEGGYGDAKRKR